LLLFGYYCIPQLFVLGMKAAQFGGGFSGVVASPHCFAAAFEASVSAASAAFAVFLK
jgi:hypothetical protein